MTSADLVAGARALIKAAPHLPPPESPSADHPFALITGRTVYHFHTRTKTGRAPELDGAAPEVWVEVNALDAARSGVHDGDLVRVDVAADGSGLVLTSTGAAPGERSDAAASTGADDDVIEAELLDD